MNSHKLVLKQHKDEVQKAVHLSNTKFKDLSISSKSKEVLIKKYKFMTKVQEATFVPITSGKDVIARAKTGTGKTVAFLLPIIEEFGKQKPQQRQQENPIQVLILSPTRELALQIMKEAVKLAENHNLKIISLIGGTSTAKDEIALENKVDIIISTPGRLIDHLQSNTAGLVVRLKSLRTLILDEADRLLDMGFKPDLEKIISKLPTNRQTLLFSATFPNSMQGMVKTALKPNAMLINTISEEEEATHLQVEQKVIVTSLEKQFAALMRIIDLHSIDRNFKIIVFFVSTGITKFYAALFNKTHSVLEMHSKMNQSKRIKTAEQFKNKSNVIMFTSDVSARGVDYPGVTLVIQVGLTTKDDYIHRLGRTARAGQSGQGICLLADFEKQYMMRVLKDLPLKETGLHIEPVQMPEIKENSQLYDVGRSGYQGFLGFYNSNRKNLGFSADQLVDYANIFATSLGMEQEPKILKRVAAKMGLQGVKGLRIESDPTKFNGGQKLASMGAHQGKGRKGNAKN